MTKGGGLPQAAPTQMAGSLRPLLAQAGNSDLTPKDCSPEAPGLGQGCPLEGVGFRAWASALGTGRLREGGRPSSAQADKLRGSEAPSSGLP